jgi:hypothetical protein
MKAVPSPTRTWGHAPQHEHGPRRLFATLVMVGLVLTVFVAPHLALPAKVPSLTIDNPGVYTVTIEASDRTDDGWITVAIVHAGQTVAAREVIDVGPTWNLRFTSQGIVLGGYEVRRSDLAAAGWHHSVPDDVINRLRDQGVPPSA